MRFAAAAAVFAGAVSAKTVYSTDYVTITSCAPEVTNCPARSTQTYSSIFAVETSSSTAAAGTTAPYPVSYPASAPPAPSAPVASSVAAVSAPSAPVSSAPWAPASSAPAYPTTIETAAETSPATGSSSVLTISTTTCVPTVIYSTILVTPTAATVATPQPSTGSSIPGYSNGTTPASPSSTYPVTAGAASLGASAGFAIVLAALVL